MAGFSARNFLWIVLAAVLLQPGTPRAASPSDEVSGLPATEVPHAALEANAFDPTSSTPHAALAEGTPGNFPAGMELQLEVTINGQPSQYIVGFRIEQNGSLSALRGDLETLRIALPDDGLDEEWVALFDVPELSYIYDEPRQTVAITLPPDRLIATQVNASAMEALEKISPSPPGVIMNYSLYAAGGYRPAGAAMAFEGASLLVDGRAVSRFGVLRQSGSVVTTEFGTAETTRLNTTWEYSDPKRQLSWKAGDLISGALPWTRSIRMGGVQIQRDFSTRPDLITMPLPSFSGTAALPSTLEVYVGNARTYSTEIPAGPFDISDVPVLSGGGTARLVLRDAQGREQEVEQEYFTSPELMAPGLFDFSAEVGYARTDAGNKSFAYDDDPLAALSLRYGLSERVTLLGHAEGGAGLLNASIGGNLSLGDWGWLTAGTGVSLKDNETGHLFHASWSKQIGVIGLSAATTRTWKDYLDLADVTARTLTPEEMVGRFNATSRTTTVDQLALGTRLPWEEASINLGVVNMETANDERSTIGSVSFSQGLPAGVSAYASGFLDLHTGRDYGLFAGFSMDIGGGRAASTTVSGSGSGMSGTANVAGYGATATGNAYQWRLAHSEGGQRATAAALDLEIGKAQLRAMLSHQGDSASGNVSADGAISLLPGGVYVTRRIDDAFAVVDVGAPGVVVMSENRPVGTTGSSGKLLVPDLRAFQSNRISIDASALPLNADVSVTSVSVRPARGSGALVAFKAREAPAAALVIINDSHGRPIELGAQVALGENAERFTVGYDGETYIQGLASENSIMVETATGTCTASFPYSPEDEQPVIGPVICI